MLDLEKGNNLSPEYTRSYLNFRKGNNLPRKCKENYSNLEKGSNSSCNSQKRLASGTGHRSITASARLTLMFQPSLKRSYFRKLKGEATQKSEATRKQTYNSSAKLFQPENGAKGEVELNHQGDVHIHIPSIKAVQSISKSEPFHCRFTKTLKGVLLTLEKDRTPAFIFNQSERRLTYRHLQKISRRQGDDQKWGSNMDITNPVKQIVNQSYLWRDIRWPKMLS